ncbi:arginine deiminase family protein [Sulfolobus tengchongensis]|uniref:Arginine deiminase family protein n=1 Tax=Sulfolobus tengchongensis TaxID=207809 RepID=A0AAX4L2I0_9CREN
MRAYANAEWNKLREIAMHKPGLEVMFGLLDSSSFLYARQFKWNKARKEHDTLRRTLKEERIVIYRLKQTLIKKIKYDKKFKDKVVDKVKVGSDDPEFLVELLILRPLLKYKERERGLHLEVTLIDPLSNLYFMRDQQITTHKGVIIGKMFTHQREKEIEVIKLFWEALGIEYNEIKTGKLEGGDFYPMGDFVLVGIGNRSDINGVKELSQLLDGKEIGVVYETKNEFFHLDTFFNVASSASVVGVEELMKESKVEVYYDNKLVNITTLYDYIMKEKGFNLISVNIKEASKYATNFLTIDDGKIISPKNPANKKFEKEGLDVIEVKVSNLTGGAGGIHCMTAIIRRD